MGEVGRFQWADYLVFGLVMAISAAVGVFFGVKDRKKMNTEHFLLAGRTMSILPVSISIFVSKTSTISFLGDPLECYKYGLVYVMHTIGYAFAVVFTAQVFAPYFHKLKLISAYELLEMRYSQGMRLLGTLASFAVTLTWMSIASYGAGITLTQVSGLSLGSALLIIGSVVTFYTTLGGMKAVLWADTLQMVIMIGGQLTVIAIGAQRVGGMDKVWQIAKDGGRINLTTDNLTLSLLSKTSITAFIVGAFFRIFNPYISHQIMIQRYGTVQTARQARNLVYLNLPMFVGLVFVMTASGLIMYAVYHDCDPLSAGIIERRDQMVPLMMIDLLGFIPGLPGLFMASLFSASLSTVSSGINSMSANLLSDLTQPLFYHKYKERLSERSSTILAKIYTVVFGVIVTFMSFVPGAVGQSIFAMCARITGLLMSPLAGVFFLAVLIPRIKIRAVVTGYLLTVIISMWLSVGSVIYPQKYNPYLLPMETYGCLRTDGNITTATSIPTSADDLQTPGNMPDNDRPFEFNDIYHIGHIHYYTFGLVGTVLIATVVHALTALCRKICHRQEKDNSTLHVTTSTQPFEKEDHKLHCENPSHQRLLKQDDSTGKGRPNTLVGHEKTAQLAHLDATEMKELESHN